jgi:hypothetical protein
MSCQDGVTQWTQIVPTKLPHLSRPQAQVLALWSYGMVLAYICGITSVVVVLAHLLGAKEETLRQRLREWCYDAEDKRGAKRQAGEVPTCFASLLFWVLAWWRSDDQRLALALDASTLSDRFTVLAISALYRGCAIPVAWKVVRAQTKGAWEPHRKALLAHLPTGCATRCTYLMKRLSTRLQSLRIGCDQAEFPRMHQQEGAPLGNSWRSSLRSCRLLAAIPLRTA